MKKLEEQFVPYQQSMDIKDLGFDEECFGYYENGVFIFRYGGKQEIELLLNCTAPLWQQAFQFFIDKYELRGITEKSKRLENLKVLIKFAKDRTNRNS
jgi:hypothetical protein